MLNLISRWKHLPMLSITTILITSKGPHPFILVTLSKPKSSVICCCIDYWSSSFALHPLFFNQLRLRSDDFLLSISMTWLVRMLGFLWTLASDEIVGFGEGALLCVYKPATYYECPGFNPHHHSQFWESNNILYFGSCVLHNWKKVV